MSPSDSQKTIDLIIPVYNEAGVVEHTYGQIREVVQPLPHTFHIFFVDDGSSDATPETLAALARQDDCITVLTGRARRSSRAGTDPAPDKEQG